MVDKDTFWWDGERISDPHTLEKRFHRYAALMAYYRCAMMEIETKFNVLNQEFSLRYDRNPIQDIRTRLKSPDSIFQKLRSRGLEASEESIHENLSDVAGVRVICSFLADVYLLADALLGQDDITLVEKKDYIKHPKESGYRSLHLVIEVPIFLAERVEHAKCEVQIRTIAMDFWASLEHRLKYKGSIDVSDSLRQRLKICAEAITEVDVEMQEIHKDIQKERTDKE